MRGGEGTLGSFRGSMSHCAGAVATGAGVCQRQPLRGRVSWILLHEPLQWSRKANPWGSCSRPRSLDHSHFHTKVAFPRGNLLFTPGMRRAGLLLSRQPHSPTSGKSSGTRMCGVNPLTAGFLGKNRLEVSASRACFCTESHRGTLKALYPSTLCSCPHSGPMKYPTRTA